MYNNNKHFLIIKVSSILLLTLLYYIIFGQNIARFKLLLTIMNIICKNLLNFRIFSKKILEDLIIPIDILFY